MGVRDALHMDHFMAIPRVSVFMPVYNGELYLKAAIESVLSQTYPHFEFVIINDGSKDGSKAIIQSYSDPRIRVIENSAPTGLMAVRNQGLRATQGEYIAPIDCDDLWHPQRLGKQVGFMDAHPAFAFVGSRAAYMDEKSQIKGISWRYGLPPQRIPPFLIFGNYFIHSSILMRKSMIPEDGYQVSTAEDYDLWVRMSRSGPIWSLPDVLVKYRVHAGGDTYRQAVLTNRTQQQIRKIYTAQLERLGINPTEEEIDIHCAINSKRFDSLAQLRQSAIWLFRIITSNKTSNIYNQNELTSVVVERWLISCFSALGFGFFYAVGVFFSINIPKKVLFISVLRYFPSFLRYLKNKELGKIG